MLTTKRIIGSFILVFIAVPILFGIIWAYGISKAIISPEFITNLPDDLLAELPTLLNEIAAESESTWYEMDEEQRIWLKAYKNSGTDLQQLIKDIGLATWVQKDLRNSFQKIGEMLRGERVFSHVELNMRPFKDALKNPLVINQIELIINKLPPCKQMEETWWQDRLEGTIQTEGRRKLKMMPCRPENLELLPIALQTSLASSIDEIPDSVELIDIADAPNRGIKLTRWASQFMLFLFIIPTLFIFLGAIIGSDSRPSFLRWLGVPTFVGGGLVFILTSSVTKFLPTLFLYNPDFQAEIRGYEFLTEKFFYFFSNITHHLFLPVNKVATITCIIGIVLIALSFAFNETNNKSEG